jgi:hypothetical protein
VRSNESAYLANVPLNPLQGFSLVPQTVVGGGCCRTLDFLAGNEPVWTDAMMRTDNNYVAL